MKRVLVIGGGIYQIPVIRRIIERGYEVLCVDGNPNAEGFKYATECKNIDVMDREACLDYACSANIDAVMTYGATLTLPTVSYIGNALNLPVLPLETAEISRNKYQIKACLKEYGCNICGDFFLLDSYDKVDKDMFQFPCVVKPCDGSGSKGVSIVYNENEIDDAVQYAFNNARYGEVYVEKYIKGTEYTVETYTSGEETHVYVIVKTTFEIDDLGEVEYGHRTPTGLTIEQEEIIAEEVVKAVSALNITMGSANFDVILSEEDGKAYIIDCGIRVGQNLIASHLVPLSRGVSVIDNAIDQALGEKIEANPKYKKCIATRLLIYSPGVIQEIKAMDDFIGKNDVIDVVMRKHVGDIQNKYKDKSDTCGWVITMGATPEIAEKNAILAKERLKEYIIIR